MKFHKLPPVLQGLVNLSTLMMMDNPYLHTWSVFFMQTNIQLKFPIALDYMTLRGRNKMENSTDSTGHTNCSTMLLKADTGADVNLMNKHSINSLVRPRTFCN